LFQNRPFQINWIVHWQIAFGRSCWPRGDPALPPSGRGLILEKLEETPEFTVTHGRAERGAHRNVIQIKAFVS
jgi:hypothetical protein